MNKSAITALCTVALALGSGMSSNAQANSLYPPYACTAENQGAIYEYVSPHRPGQAYRLIRWECSGEWYVINNMYCYAEGYCIEL